VRLHGPARVRCGRHLFCRTSSSAGEDPLAAAGRVVRCLELQRGSNGFVCLAVWFGSRTSPRSVQEYRFYKDFLVERFPHYHRIIPWDQIGCQKPTAGLAKTHRFPVLNQADVRFNYELKDHEALAKAIATHASAYRFREAMGGE